MNTLIYLGSQGTIACTSHLCSVALTLVLTNETRHILTCVTALFIPCSLFNTTCVVFIASGLFVYNVSLKECNFLPLHTEYCIWRE